MSRARRWALWILLGLSICLHLHADDRPAEFRRFAPLEPKQVGSSFRVQNGFRLDLIAAEPLVMDPVAAAYDEDGRLYVVEMSDYPHVKAENDRPFAENLDDPPVGRVRLLVDTDDDGVFDQSHIFAEKLSWPTGIVCWKGGVFVAATPEIIYLRDNDNDHKADVREIVFTGFRKYNVQAVMNNLQWNLEHKILGAGSSNGGAIRSATNPNSKPVSILRRDFQFDPSTRAVEAISGGARFGNTSDDWGNRFLCDIRNPVQHVVLPLDFLERHPDLALTRVLHDCAPSGDAVQVFRISPPEPWREFRARRWASLGKKMPRSELVGAGFLTSSSGLTVYRGDAYPPDFRGNLFLGEVANNLVFRMKVEPDGVTFKATRANEGVEFLASTDTWFRPVNFVNAPDGTLHLLDMYRETIEHPWSIPDDIRAKLDLRSGEDRGRIYRITPPEFRHRSTPRLSQATSKELVALLAHPNAWHRDTAHRLLFERQDKGVVPELESILSKAATPIARLHALWTLDGLKELRSADLLQAMTDPSPGVREAAVMLVKNYLKDNPHSDVRLERGWNALIHDSSRRVSFQALMQDRAPALLKRLPELSPEVLKDPWMRMALLGYLSSDPVAALSGYSEPGQRLSTEQFDFLRSLSRIVGIRGPQDPSYQRLLDRLAAPGTQADDSVAAMLLGLGEGLAKTGRRIGFSDGHSQGHQIINQVVESATRSGMDGNRARAERERSVRLLGVLDRPGVVATLSTLIDTEPDTPLRLVALEALSQHVDADVPRRLLKDFDRLPASLKVEVVRTLLSRGTWIPDLLDAIKKGKVPAGLIPATSRSFLLSQKDIQIQALAREVFSASVLGPRVEVIKAYRPPIDKPGDVDRGRLVFDRECATCHKLGDRGFSVGPNLAGVVRRTADELLVQILDPNREVSPDFLEYTIALKDGRVLAGLITGETSSSVTLRKAGGAEETVLRVQVEEMKGTGRSLMPEGLEKNVKPDEMADLLAYLLNVQSQ